jgi:ferredoxin
MKIAVVGSGPAGWAATKKLLDLGHEVTVFTGDIKQSDDKPDSSKSGLNDLNNKLLNGSDFPYRNFSYGPGKVQKGVNVSSSFAFSGLSLVWGATMLPYAKEDISTWPINLNELDAAYSYLSKIIPIAGMRDNLARKYTPYLNENPLFPTKRILNFLEISNSHNPRGFTFGTSRLAVTTKTSKIEGCNYCGHCLTGCPGNFIWASPEISNEHVKYFKNERVISIQESELDICVSTVNAHGATNAFGGFDKIFIGCGPIETFRILATSGIVELSALLIDSRTFFLPLLLGRSYPKPEKSSIALSQAFARYEGADHHPLQLQIYDYSDDLIQRARKVVPLGFLIPQKFLRLILGRLFVAIGYFDSRDSTQIRMSLQKNGDVLLEKSERRERVEEEILGKFLKKERKTFRKLHMIPLSFLRRFALPGEGVHTGGWLPMGRGSDGLGVPTKSKKIHVIDSSILPTIPAGAITFTVMANAVRIAGIAGIAGK